MASFKNPYSRTGASSTEGTIIPGMQPVKQEGQKKLLPSYPVVGFLYSISRQGIGEYWPLHIGRNTIGRSSECDVCLQEGTVSDLHAALNIKQMQTTKKLSAQIRDEGSKNGIFVNDEELDFDVHSCVNGDIITIGLHYKLLLILVDADAYGLSVDEDFVAVDADESSILDEGFGETDYTYSNTGATIAIDGERTASPEKTTIM